jgi:proline iminopeptidase
MKKCYPVCPVYQTHTLKVSTLHTLYIEESGNPNGIPILHIHGGPGSCSKPKHRQFYNPEKYRIILYDQRGCGKSTPTGEIKENTTTDLVEDIEKIRKYLKIDKWVINGGSWGSTLALLYSIQYPNTVKALIVRGIFLFRQIDLDWFYGYASFIYPDLWDGFLSQMLEKYQDDFLSFYFREFQKELKEIDDSIVLNFANWEGGIYKLETDKLTKEDLTPELKEELVYGARILLHYMVEVGPLDDETILENIDSIRHIPAVIINGRYDMVTPMMGAWDLKTAWPEAKFELITLAGHHSSEPGVSEKIIEYTDKFAS